MNMFISTNQAMMNMKSVEKEDLQQVWHDAW
jgi:hypothetical protein